MWLQRLITNTSKQKKISQNKLLWESKNWGFLTLTNLFVPEHLDSKFYPGEIFLQLLTDFFFPSCPFFPNKRPYIQQYLGSCWCILRKDQIQFKFLLFKISGWILPSSPDSNGSNTCVIEYNPYGFGLTSNRTLCVFNSFLDLGIFSNWGISSALMWGMKIIKKKAETYIWFQYSQASMHTSICNM